MALAKEFHNRQIAGDVREAVAKDRTLIILFQRKEQEKYIGVYILIPVLERIYNKQLTGYAQIRYKTLSSKNEPDKIGIIYDSDTFVSAI